MEENKKNKKTPPSKEIKSVQFDLFASFVSNNVDAVSNTIEIWEKIPKYFFTARQIEKLRPKTGQPDPYKWTYEESGKEYSVVIQPALLEQEDGSYKAFFPSSTEELVEEALKRILTQQNYGIHNPTKHETWVKFSLSMLAKELKKIGKGRTRPQIKQAITVMSRTVITLYRGKKELWSGNILQDLVTVDRDEYLEDTSAYHVARLPLFVSHAIDRLQTRQFNYERLMGCNEQLSRWIYKRLINRYIQAGIGNDYHFMYSDLENSGLLQQSRETDNRKKVISALNELKKQEVIRRYIVNEKLEGRKIKDIKYTIEPSYVFITEQKAANKRVSSHHQHALNSGWISPPVDKS